MHTHRAAFLRDAGIVKSATPQAPDALDLTHTYVLILKEKITMLKNSNHHD